MSTAAANPELIKVPLPSESTKQILFALCAMACLLLGIGLTPFLSAHFEQRVFSLLIFSSLQLLPLLIALRLQGMLVARIQLLAVALYFLLAMLANLFFPDMKTHLALVFYAYCLVVVLLALGTGLLAARALVGRLLKR
ncbi:hypothetical protein [Undibacterium sp. TS12]|uniref:hypothetical protein n=1 Tax=Undibacterium sp. TS12 TaxID=2908202 RepID=UPI001F4CDA97|nr:hypothetical protein [Undibacterium sp. TS12]MCH8621261.1 hypothetical protein [Undibacterium sp. TS12]